MAALPRELSLEFRHRVTVDGITYPLAATALRCICDEELEELNKKRREILDEIKARTDEITHRVLTAKFEDQELLSILKAIPKDKLPSKNLVRVFDELVKS